MHKSNRNYKDNRIGFDEWEELKPRYPGGTVPCWEEGTLMMNETTAILRYLGKKYGFYPASRPAIAA